MVRGSAEKETYPPLFLLFFESKFLNKLEQKRLHAMQAKRSVTPIVKLFLLRSFRRKSINCFETGPVRVFFLIQED